MYSCCRVSFVSIVTLMLIYIHSMSHFSNKMSDKLNYKATESDVLLEIFLQKRENNFKTVSVS